ncbi:MAG: XdhC family protein [Porticoccaceae bacterium]
MSFATIYRIYNTSMTFPISTHLFYLLKEFRKHPSDSWVSATVVSKQRSSYRLPGAMMLVNPDGLNLGLVSGGCLEADIRLQACKVLSYNEARCIIYDSMDEDNIAAELGLGCNGRVEVLVQKLEAAHQEILYELYNRMEAGKNSYLLHCLGSETPAEMNALVLLDEYGAVIANTSQVGVPSIDADMLNHSHQLLVDRKRRWSMSLYRPPINLWIFGGGVDARPMVSLAASLGWRVTLVDHRTAYAREKDFHHAETILRQKPEDFDGAINADAALLMTHNLNLDASWLSRLNDIGSLRYVGILGPVDRKQEAIEIAGIKDSSGLLGILHGPMGFDIGGDIPESIALSTLAQCHQILFGNERRRQP